MGSTPARGVLLTVLGLIVWGLLAGTQVSAGPTTSVDPKRYSNDFDLYSTITDRVAHGEDYYSAAVAEQVEAGYPVEPAATVRLPTLVHLNAALGEEATYALLLILVAAVAVLALVRFETLAQSRSQWIGLILLLVIGLVQVASPPSVQFAESWVLLLTLAAILLGIDERPRTALLLTALALCLREHTLVFVGAASLWLWLRGRRRLALAWAGLALMFLVGYFTLHVPHVTAAVAGLDSDIALPTSAGWLEFGGWPRVVDYVRAATPLAAVPFSVAAVIVPLSLLGWAMRDDPMAEMIMAVCISYAVVFSVIGRANNLYWGLLFSALVLPGLALSLCALRRCATDARAR